MKKLLLVVFLFVLKIGIAQQMNFVLDQQTFSCTLIPNRIFVTYYEDQEYPDLGELFDTDMMDLVTSDPPENHMQLIKLNGNYTSQRIKDLLELLNTSPHIKLACPLIQSGDKKAALTNKLIVKLKTTFTVEDLNTFCNANNVENLGVVANMDRYYALSFSKNKILNQVAGIAQLKATTMFDFVEPNFIRFLDHYSLDDPLYSSQYALTTIKASDAWTKMGVNAGGSNTTIIAVLDDGVDLFHPEFAGRLYGGFDATYTALAPSGQSLSDTQGGPLYQTDIHGTNIAGIFGATGNNTTGIVGLAYNCRIMPIRAGRKVGSSFVTDDYVLANAFGHAWMNGADVITNSWGGGFPSSTISSAIESATIQGRGGKGCPVFFAVGNSSSTILPYPATLSYVIGVGATNASDQKASFSNYSIGLDISAPGDGIITTDRIDSSGVAIGAAGNYTTVSGTSFSAPYAAGLMGLILSVKPNLTMLQAREIIESTCDKVGGYNYSSGSNPNGAWSNELGYGRINASAAIAKALFVPFTSGPFVATVTQPANNCYWSGAPDNSAYFDLKISGGSPDTYHWSSQTGTGYKSYSINYFADANHTVPSPYVQDGPSHPNTSYFTQNTIGPISGDKRIYLTFPPGTTFPFQTDIYVDVYSLVNNVTVHNYVTVHVSIDYAPDFTLVSQVNHCNFGNLYTFNTVTGMMAPTGSTFSWALGNYPNTAAYIDYMADPKYPSIYVLTHDETITLSVTSPTGCTTSKSTLVKVGNIQVNPAPATIMKCTLDGIFQIGPNQISGNIGLVTFQWTPAPGLSSTNSKNPIINPVIAGPGLHNYTVTITDTYGCTATYVYPVDIQVPLTTVNLTADYDNGCPGHDIKITGNINGPYGIYYDIKYFSGSVSSPTVLITPTLSKTTVSPYTSTVYQFSAKDPYGCPVASTIPITVQTNYTLAANAGPDTYSCYPDLRTITGSASGGVSPYSYHWLQPDIYSPQFTIPNGTSSYTLEVKDSNGCRALDQVQITSSPPLGAASLTTIAGIEKGTSLPSGSYYHAGSGGAPPYTYMWTPASLLVDPTVYNPTTMQLVESVALTNTITDSRGCTSSHCNNLILVLGEKEPLQLFPNYDPCISGELKMNTLIGGLANIDGTYTKLTMGPVANGYDNFSFLPSCNTRMIPTGVQSAYTFNPAPISHTGTTFQFAPNVTSVSITVDQVLGNNGSIGPQHIYKTYYFNYNFPPKDDSRSNMIFIGTDVMVYVGLDQILHKIVWENVNGVWKWIHHVINPQGGWGNTRVEGWLAVNDAQTGVYFKGTDQQMYMLVLPLTSNPFIMQMTAPVNVKGDVVYRQDGLFFVGSDNLIHRFDASNVHDNSFTSSIGWSGLTVTGSLALATYPQTHMAFLGSDNLTHYLYQSSGWNLGTASTTPSNGETMIDPQNGGVYYKTMTNKILALMWNSSLNQFQNQVILNSDNDPGYEVDGFMVKEPNSSRIFYKDNFGRISNLYVSGSSIYTYPLSYYMTDAAGDIRLIGNRIFYINKDKYIHEMSWNQGAWSDNAHIAGIPQNVKACGYSYKSMSMDNSERAESIESKFLVYPNPVNGVLTIDYQYSELGNYRIEVTDLTSRLVKLVDLTTNGGKSEIDLKEYVEGVYFINLFRDGVLLENEKILIKH